MPTGSENTEAKVDVLVDGSGEPIASLEVLLDTCLAALTARVWETCSWPDVPGRWTIGDFRFSIIEFQPAPDVSLYVQLWSEPEEPVLVEVSSGNWNPGALRYVWRTQRKALEQQGFVVGGAARNFQKEVVVGSPDEAETLARETLAVFFDVFGYRVAQPLTVTLHSGSRSERRPVHMALSPEDFTKIAEQNGFHASLVAGDATVPIVALERGPLRSVAIFGSPIPGRNLFGSVLLRAPVRESSPTPLLDPTHGDVVCARFSVDGDGRVMAETSLSFDGGVTTEWVAKSLDRWRRAVGKYLRMMKQRRADTVRSPRTSKGRVSVH